jgi:hypothetical protein
MRDLPRVPAVPDRAAGRAPAREGGEHFGNTPRLSGVGEVAGAGSGRLAWFTGSSGLYGRKQPLTCENAEEGPPI